MDYLVFTGVFKCLIKEYINMHWSYVIQSGENLLLAGKNYLVDADGAGLIIKG